VYTTASVGIVTNAVDFDRPEDLLRDADTALRRAKAQGRARYVVFDEPMCQLALRRLQLETELRRTARQNAVEAYYQPVISLTTGEIVGFEALMRWLHPEHGLIAPDQFIIFAEETGLIRPLGRHILKQACAQGRSWQEAEQRSLWVAVNISAPQVQHPDFVTEALQALDETGLSPSCLRLELTESVWTEGIEATTAALQELNSQGIEVAIDDYGTGYSSLNHLKTFPVCALKIAQTFVRGLPDNPNDAAIVKATLSMAADLGLEVTAEGVETEEQLAFLRAHNCSNVQGYLLGRPMPAGAIPTFMQSYRA
jgi:EAL domain-containing protein (putative c-di-GMP-specific phosphodiesterase class I)